MIQNQTLKKQKQNSRVLNCPNHVLLLRGEANRKKSYSAYPVLLSNNPYKFPDRVKNLRKNFSHNNYECFSFNLYFNLLYNFSGCKYIENNSCGRIYLRSLLYLLLPDERFSKSFIIYRFFQIKFLHHC